MSNYQAQCACGSIEIEMNGPPRVRGFCHCGDCRELLNVPYYAVNAWLKENVNITKGEDNIQEYQHPNLRMKKFICKTCGDVVFNSNSMDWRVFSQLFIAKNYDGILPDELKSKSHFFYGRRIIDVNDDLPKRG